MESDKILFYGGGFNCFSNLSSYAVEIDSLVFPTSEHAYQYAKFSDPMIKEKILNARSGYDAKMIAKENNNAVTPNWHQINLDVMERILRKKLEQHPHIRKKLLETGSREIIETSNDDDFWGWGPNKTGQNNHGKIWMQLRRELIN
ncbi:MAG: NADAR family protein [Patescibacteria group bacterium]